MRRGSKWAGVGRARVWCYALVGVCLWGCGGDSGTQPDEQTQGATLVGTLTLPAPAEGKTYAVAVDDNTQSGDGFVRVITGTCGSGTRVEYRIPEVPEGTYFLYAVVWVVGSALSPPQSGDYVGFYGVEAGIPALPNARVPGSGEARFDITLTVLP